MKIALIYSYVEKESWSTPLSLAIEFQNRGWEVNIYSILSTAGNYTDAGIKLMYDEISAGYKPDIILYMDWGRFDSPLLDKSLYPEAYWIQESGDDPQNYSRNFPKSERFNLTFSSDYLSTQKYLAAGRNAIWLTHFADTKIYKPLTTGIKYELVSTRGRGSSGILDALYNHYGDKKFHNQNGYLGDDHAEALQSGKIVVQHSRWGEITRRIFEAMACGRMVITDRLNPDTHIDELFTDGVDIVYYDNLNDCIDKIEYYLSHPTERETIALAGKKQTLKFHTQYQRVNSLLEKFRLWKKNK